MAHMVEEAREQSISDGLGLESVLTGLLAGCTAATAPQTVARLGADPVLSGGSYDSGGGITVAIDLREQMTLCDAGNVFTIPANLEKSFDQISRAVSHVASSGSFPIMIGGDHSIGYPCVKGIADVTSKKIGIVHFDRHADIQEKDLDERMHTTPWFHATNMPNVPAKNLVQVGIGGWQVPREAVKVARERETNIITMSDMERMGVDRTAEMALEMAWDGVDMVYMSFDIDSIDCGFVPGTGWPEPGGFLPREALALASKVAAEGLCGMELVEVSPPYDVSDITALMGTRVIVDVLGSMVAAGKMGAHKRHIDKPVSLPHGDWSEATHGRRWGRPSKG